MTTPSRGRGCAALLEGWRRDSASEGLEPGELGDARGPPPPPRPVGSGGRAGEKENTRTTQISTGGAIAVSRSLTGQDQGQAWGGLRPQAPLPCCTRGGVGVGSAASETRLH